MTEDSETAMETDEVLKDACRLCDETTDKMVSVFDKNGEGKQFLHIIKECLPIIIYRSDPLSKKICEGCLTHLNNVEKFRKTSKETDQKHKEKLKSSTGDKNKDELLYLGIENDDETVDDQEEPFMMHGLIDVCTSTEDLPILCLSCKQAVVDASTVNGELELNGDLQKIVAETLNKQRKVKDDAGEKVLRNRRKKPQPFYHELDDSLCSSMTEFTQNTESSQCFDDHSEAGSVESDRDEVIRPSKRRRIDYDESSSKEEVSVTLIKKAKKHVLETPPNEEEDEEGVEEEEDDEEIVFHREIDFRYNPLSLLQLALNVINVQIIPDYVANDFYMQEVQAECRYCDQKFQNTKILALHEVCHMDVEIGDKVDNPALWSASKGDCDIRNKWLAYFDENGYEEDDLVLDQSLLIPIEMADLKEDEDHHDDLVTLEGTKPVVRGVPLQEYSKEERKNFYQSIVVGGVKKRFCQICRYSFKDNWAIESHYFSSACYYTCKYCGMRFNKQRHRFEEHIEEHVSRGDPVILDKIYAPSKVNNYMPKVIQPDKQKKLLQQQQKPIEEEQPEFHPPNSASLQEIKSRFSRKSLQPNLKDDPSPPPTPINLQPGEIITSQSKTGNQAFFCRKCYKVFFKLDEFNIHSKNCDFNQYPGFVASKPAPTFNNAKAAAPAPPPPPLKNGDATNRMNRPIRNCAKEVGTYKDEAYIPEVLLKEPTPRHTNLAGPPFVCFICKIPFPTVYSRNSHMRIHKGENNSPGSSKPRPQGPSNHFLANNSLNEYRSPPQQQQQQQQPHHPPFKSNYNNTNEPFIKQEPLEPEIQIHESESSVSSMNSIGGGAVSITPIPKKNNQRLTINPDIYKLVQDNPNISIKKSPDKFNSPPIASGSQMMLQNNAEDKSYKCSSCWEAFANKSHLYFHKKNQCEGSRFPCPFCKKRFGTEAAYSSHIFYSHPE